MKKQLVFHPGLFALWPALTLYILNSGHLFFSDVASTLVGVVGVTLALWAAICLLIKHLRKSALITSMIVISFFSYGQIITPFDAPRPELKLLVWLGLIGGLACLIARTRRTLDQATVLLNIMSMVLICSAVMPWLYYRFIYEAETTTQVERYMANWKTAAKQFETAACGVVRPQVLPDIYYIVLDGFGRADVLKEFYQIDNPDWLAGLRQMGFYVADQSTSNYGHTVLSLAATLNFTYLDELTQQINTTATNRLPLRAMLEENHVFQLMRCAGYTVVSFPTGNAFTDNVSGADLTIAPPGSLNVFQNLLARTTALPALSAVLLQKTEYDYLREHILYTFEHLKDVAKLDQPAFVLAHVLAPHPPFVFGLNAEQAQSDLNQPLSFNDGNEFITAEGQKAYVTGYRAEVKFIAERALRSIAEIRANSTRPTVIMVQADHGPGSMLSWGAPETSNFHERMSILNAYYFPDHDYTALYPGISSVNTFRVVLNKYFGTAYQLLEDRNYFSGVHLYDLVDITDDVKSSPR